MTALSLNARAQRYFDGLLRRVQPGSDGMALIGGSRIYILPTRTGLLYGVVLMAMLLGSLNYQNNLGLLLTFFLAAVGIVAMHHTWFNLRGLAVQARGGPAVFVGENARFEVCLYAARRPRYDLRILYRGEQAAPVALAPEEQTAIKLQVPAERRGWLRLQEVRVETGYPLGLFCAWALVATPAKTLVYPRPAPTAPEPGHDAGDGHQPQRARHEEAEDYLGVRPYRPGDPLKQVDWKAFARERGLWVKQYGGEQGQEVWIDWSAINAADSELRLNLLTRQVLDASTTSTRFGLRLPGVVEPVSQGPEHTERCLIHLALFGYEQGQASA
ncbi:DUF58 domain-containing protein [Caldichromatium japonicum]|uniref:DUF58 domain-containing protein n=1 Tax=Caldichromatium japonicum TaxID=2699430 RepID=A0A6G7VA19_9GAMM|nr:DUF58 domain-containing protein [Caldichromatium japonicum]QIK36698.1 DUF58 domain-containing protein [Caldichromatium japonicum]